MKNVQCVDLLGRSYKKMTDAQFVAIEGNVKKNYKKIRDKIKRQLLLNLILNPEKANGILFLLKRL